MTKCTKNEREFRHPPNGSKCTPLLSYKKSNGERTEISMKMDVFGYQIPSHKLAERMMQNYYDVHQTIERTKARFLCQLVAATYQVEQEEGYPMTLDNGKKKSFWQHNNEARKHYRKNKQAWKAKYPRLTEFEIYLLEYSLMTGNLINHQPLPAHSDTSKGHVMETMDLIAKVNPDDTRDSMTIAEEAALHTGQLIAPMQHFGIEIRPHKDQVTVDFSATSHLADNTRGTTNMSRVHHTPRTVYW